MSRTVYLEQIINDDEIPKAALNGMHRTFEANKARGSEHAPSAEQWDGLKQIIKTIEAMACRLHEHPDRETKLPGWSNSFYASFLDCGVGKTAAVIETVKAILSLPKYNHVSFIVFLSRYEEIKNLVERMGLSDDKFAVITSDEEVNKLGNQQKGKARVLFTTQKMLEKRSKLQKLTFEQMKNFYYNNKPRQVRIWDEAILPSAILTLERRRIERMYFDFQSNKDLENCLRDFVKILESAKDGDLIETPIFSKYGIDMHQAIASVHADDANAVETLFELEGRIVRITKDKEGSTTLHYEDFLPDDLRPMLILDASGRQRKTYAYWAKHRKGLETLYSPEKDYTPYTIHHWDEGAGKRSQTRGKYKLIAEGISKKINSLSDEECLVIHFKKGRLLPDMEAEIKRLVSNPERVKFLHYGKHTATNDYSHIKHVFLAGILQYNTAQYVATALAAKGVALDHSLSADELLEIRYGEIAHHVLQAACRGKVRNCVADTCPTDCHLYIIFPTNKGTGIPQQLLSEIFPGAQIKDWRPVVNIKGKAMELLKALTKAKPGTIIPKTTLLRQLQINQQSQLNALLKHPDLQAKLRELGLRLIVSRASTQLLPILETRRPLNHRTFDSRGYIKSSMVRAGKSEAA